MKLANLHAEPGFPDLILYDAMVADGTLLCQDGSFLAAWQYRGPDMASHSNEEMAALSGRLSRILMLGGGWMLHCSAIRSSTESYPGLGAFPDPVTRQIDDERREEFLDEGAHYESAYFLAVTWQPPVQAEERVKGWMFSGDANTDGDATRALREFEARVATIEDNLRSPFTVRRLGRDQQTGGHDLLRHVHQCITGLDHPVMLPENPSCLQDVVGCVDFVGGIEPTLDGRHLRVIAIDGFPLRSTPGILAVLDTLAIEYRWTTRAMLLDAEEARVRIEATRKKWRSKTFGFIDKLRRVPDGAPSRDAQDMEADAADALGDAASGMVQFALYDSQVILLDASRDRIDESCAEVMKVIRNAGFACRLETINAVEAFLGGLPGDGYRNVRRSMLHTLNLADMLPVTSVWSGARECPSPLMPAHSPALFYASTTGAAPFRFNLHVGDVGHTLMVGPTGSGKSSLLALITAQWFRYPNAQVFGFDKGHSLYALTRAAGGEFYEPARDAEQGFSLQPLAHLDTDSDIAWANEWLETLCALQNCPVGPRERSLLAAAIRLLASSPRRTMTELRANVQDQRIREALEPYVLGGSLGNLLDGEAEGIRKGRLVTFELGSLMQMGEKAVSAVLPYLFRRIIRQVEHGSGEPTLVVVDEAWVALKHERFRDAIREWLRTLRKYNGAVVLVTQSLSDVFTSPIRDVILESCLTKILLPNAEAGNPASREHYAQLGLGEREIEMIAGAMPKRDYYCVSQAGRRMITLRLGPVALAFCGANSAEERARVDVFASRWGARWPAEWLRSRGLSDQAVEMEMETVC